MVKRAQLDQAEKMKLEIKKIVGMFGIVLFFVLAKVTRKEPKPKQNGQK